MAKKLLLLDADVIIDFHKNNFWGSVISHYSLYVGSVVASEVIYYSDSQNTKIPIDFQAYLGQGKVTKVAASLVQIAETLTELKRKNLDGLDAGELESIVILKNNIVQDLLFCVRDKAAIKAIAYLDLEDKSLSAEKILLNCGIPKQKISFENSDKRFKGYITEGKFYQI